MKKLLTGLALVAAMALAYTPAHTQQTKKPTAEKSVTHKRAPSRSVSARTALCKADCRPNNFKDCGTWGCVGMHGYYRSYNEFDPHLTSIEGRKQFAQCVKACVDPLPRIYVQKPILEAGGKWFGKSAADCMACHAKGPNLRVPGEK